MIEKNNRNFIKNLNSNCISYQKVSFFFLKLRLARVRHWKIQFYSFLNFRRCGMKSEKLNKEKYLFERSRKSLFWSTLIDIRWWDLVYLVLNAEVVCWHFVGPLDCLVDPISSIHILVLFQTSLGFMLKTITHNRPKIFCNFPAIVISRIEDARRVCWKLPKFQSLYR